LTQARTMLISYPTGPASRDSKAAFRLPRATLPVPDTGLGKLPSRSPAGPDARRFGSVRFAGRGLRVLITLAWPPESLRLGFCGVRGFGLASAGTAVPGTAAPRKLVRAGRVRCLGYVRAGRPGDAEDGLVASRSGRATRRPAALPADGSPGR
jgi:hypothetical protein